jgi:hypothetical protein
MVRVKLAATTAANLPASVNEELAALEAYAAEGQSSWLPRGAEILKFNGTSGELTTKTDPLDDLIGLEVVCDTRNVFHGWTKFVDGKIAGKPAIVRVSQRPKNRSELGDLDETEWPTDTDGKPKDPWGFATYMPMMGRDQGETYIYISTSRSGQSAVQNLIGVYANKVREKGDLDRLPIVRWGKESFRSKYKGKLWAPVLQVLAWRVVDFKDFADPPERKAIAAPKTEDTPASRFDDDRENRRRGKATVQTSSGRVVDKRRKRDEADDDFDREEEDE